MRTLGREELCAAQRGLKPPSPGVLSLATPLLAGQATEGMDSATLQFLTASALRRTKEEERKQELDDEALDNKLEAEFDALMATSRQEARLSAVLRERAELIERKKRRKKKLPRSGCTRRRRRQWHDRCTGLLVVMHLEMCSLWSTTGPRCSASWPVWTRRTRTELVGFC